MKQILSILQCLWTIWLNTVNYSDTSRSLRGFKRDEIVNNAEVTNDDNASSFKYKAGLIGDTETYGTKKGVKIAVPLKYLSNFWRSLGMPFINCKVKLSLRWIESCVLTTAENGANANATGANSTIFKITDAKLSKLLGDGFKRSIYWNKYKVIHDRLLLKMKKNT